MSALARLRGAALLLGALGAGISIERRAVRRRLNAATHELRRPLQALALVRDEESRGAWMAQVAAGLADLESRINGEPLRERSERLALATILADARRRWAPLAAVDFEDGPGVVELIADPRSVGAALDNLIANAVEHGSGPVVVRAARSGERARLEVVNGPAEPGRRAAGAGPRRGHGLRAGARIASAHDGRLLTPAAEPGARRIVAGLELPGAGG